MDISNLEFELNEVIKITATATVNRDGDIVDICVDDYDVNGWLDLEDESFIAELADGEYSGRLRRLLKSQCESWCADEIADALSEAFPVRSQGRFSMAFGNWLPE